MATTLESRVAVNEGSIKRLENTIYGNGQPGLEAKLMGSIGVLKGEMQSHVDRVERHTAKNIEQGDGDLLAELQQERIQRERMHKETNDAREADKKEFRLEQKELGKKVDRLTLFQATLTGGLLLFKVLEDFGFIHIGAGK